MTDKQLRAMRRKIYDKRYMEKALKVAAEKIADILLPVGDKRDERADKAKA